MANFGRNLLQASFSIKSLHNKRYQLWSKVFFLLLLICFPVNLLKPTGYVMHQQFNPLNTKRRLLYLKTQFVPRSKHFSSLL